MCRARVLFTLGLWMQVRWLRRQVRSHPSPRPRRVEIRHSSPTPAIVWRRFDHRMGPRRCGALRACNPSPTLSHHDHSAGLLTESLAAGLVAVASSNASSGPTGSTSVASIPSSGRGGKASQHDDSASLHARTVVYVWSVDAGLMAPTSSAVTSEPPTSSGGGPPQLTDPRDLV